MSIEHGSGPQSEETGGSAPEQAVDPAVYAHPEGTAATPEQAEEIAREQSRFVEWVLGGESDVTELLESVSFEQSRAPDLSTEEAVTKIAETTVANLGPDKLHALASRWDGEGGRLTDEERAVNYLRSAMRGEQRRRGFE